MTKPNGTIKTEGRTTSIILAGVGGQGVILASELVARLAALAGYDAKQTEVHGVSQRGGSVHSHVRFGPQVFSPLVAVGEANVVFGMEKLEALRFAHYIAPGGAILVNDHEILPLSAGDIIKDYPHNSVEYLQEKGLNAISIPASDLALELGNIRAANVVMLGGLSHLLDIPQEKWEETLRGRIPERFLELNLKAFAKGAEAVAQAATA
jgi:indolepyruvate ferredoxin oxidoreductase beta subunit